MEIDPRLVAEFGCIDPVYVDGIAAMVRLGGNNFATMFFRWQMSSAGIYEKIPAANIVRPVDSIITCRKCFFKDVVGGLPVPPGGPNVNSELH